MTGILLLAGYGFAVLLLYICVTELVQIRRDDQSDGIGTCGACDSRPGVRHGPMWPPDQERPA